MTRAQDWVSVPAAAAAVLLSLALGSWVLSLDSKADEPAVASGAVVASATPQRDEVVSPLAQEPGVLALAERSRDVLVGLAARPGGPVELVAITSSGEPVGDGALSVKVGAAAVTATPCGAGCFRVDEPVFDGSPAAIVVEVERPGKPVAAVSFRLPGDLPADGETLLGKVRREMGTLTTLRMSETLTSGLGPVVRTEYRLEAPDRIGFETSGGQRTIIVGKRRWDREGGRWVESPFPGSQVPTYVWDGAKQPRLLGSTTLRGTPVQILALYDPNLGPAWFRLLVAPNGRVLEARMLAPAHFMTQRFRGFDEPVRLEAPS